MKHLKEYKIFENLEDDLIRWINIIINNCRDILLEAQDEGYRTRVSKSPFMIETNKVSILCEIFIPFKIGNGIKEQKIRVTEYFNRLSEYLTEEGFIETNRNIKIEMSNFINLDEQYYRLHISFKKENLKSEVY